MKVSEKKSMLENFRANVLKSTVLSEFSLLVTTFSRGVCSLFPFFAAMELSDRQLEAKDDVRDGPLEK